MYYRGNGEVMDGCIGGDGFGLMCMNIKATDYFYAKVKHFTGG